MRHALWRLLALLLVLWPVAAEAHSPITGLGTFYNSMLHPLLVPAHALLLLAIALMLGQQGRDTARPGLVVFGLCLVAGLMISGAGMDASVDEPMLLAGALLMGGFVSLARRLPRPAPLCAAAVGGLAIGLASTPEASALREAVLAYAGLVTGILYLATVICGLTVGLVGDWQRIGVRIVGSWIVAACVMVLALMLAGPRNHEAADRVVLEKARSC